MAEQSANRGITIAMGVAILVGVAISFISTDIGDWELSDWVINLAGVLLAIVLFVVAGQGRALPDRLAPQVQSARRLRALSIFSIIAFGIVLLLFLGAELTGAFEATDGVFAGVIAAGLIFMIGQLSVANRALKSEG